MKFHHEMKYDAAPGDVHAMLTDPAFREKVSREQDMVRSDVTIEPRGEGTRVEVDQSQKTDGIPSFATKFVGDQVRLVSVEEWSGPDSADLHLSIPGKPGELEGTITLEGDGEGTREVVDGELKVGIPLVGAKLEKLIADLLAKALRTEEKVGRDWLAGNR